MNNFNSENQTYLRDTVELYPTKDQFDKIIRFINVNLIIWNQFIQYENQAYLEREDGCRKYGWLDKKELDILLRKFTESNELVSEVPLNTRRRMVNRAEIAQIRFVKNIANKPKPHDNKYKKSFDPRSDHGLYFKDGYVQIEGIGKVKCQYRNYDKSNRFKSATVVVDNLNKVYLSLAYIVDKTSFDYEKTEVLGIDLGSRANNSNTIVCSNGTRYCQPNVSKIDKTIKRFQRRCKTDENNRLNKAKKMNIDINDLPYSNRERENLDRYHKALKRKHNVLNTFYDQATADIIKKNPEAIVIEPNDAKKIKMDSPYIHSERVYYGSIMEKLEYKSNLHYIPYFVVNRGFPASKICSNCGRVNNPGSSQTYHCDYCGAVIDRDDNASINLKRLYNERNDDFRLINGYTKQSPIYFRKKQKQSVLYFL